MRAVVCCSVVHAQFCVRSLFAHCLFKCSSLCVHKLSTMSSVFVHCVFTFCSLVSQFVHLLFYVCLLFDHSSSQALVFVGRLREVSVACTRLCAGAARISCAGWLRRSPNGLSRPPLAKNGLMVNISQSTGQRSHNTVQRSHCTVHIYRNSYMIATYIHISGSGGWGAFVILLPHCVLHCGPGVLHSGGR